MDRPPSRDTLSTTVVSARNDDAQGGSIYRQYYTENDFVLSPEGILKLLSAIVGLVSSALLLSVCACAARGASVAAPACGVATVLLYGAIASGLSLYAPQACLLIDIIATTVMGLVLLMMAVLTMSVCEFREVVSYVHGPLGLVNGSMLLGNAVVTYVSVMRQRDVPVRVAIKSTTERPAIGEQEA